MHVRTSYSYCTTALRFPPFQTSVLSFNPVDYKVESSGYLTLLLVASRPVPDAYVVTVIMQDQDAS